MFFSIIEVVLLSGLLLFFLLQVIYYLCNLRRPSRYYKDVKKGKIHPGTSTPPVSVIICALNESENLAKYLPVVLEQDYPQYEVIVVNEGSSDSSEEVLDVLETKYKHLYHTYIPREAKNLSKKKLAITLGIKAARYDVLLFTEADCVPASSDWIKSMVRHFDDETEMVLGYGALPKSSGLIGKLAVFDNLISGLQYLSSALKRSPYMGVNRNLAYRKDLFYKGNGFHTFLRLHAGEDDLFVNENANRNNTKVEISEVGLTTMDFCDFKFWKEMKVKRLTTSRFYKWGLNLFARFDAFFVFAFWVFALGSIVFGALHFSDLPSLILLSSGCFVVIVRWIVQGVVLNQAAKVLQQGEKFYWSLPLLDLLRPWMDAYFRLYHTFKGHSDYIWKI